MGTAEIVGNALLFILVFAMSATVSKNNLCDQFDNWKALVTGACLQFFVLPFLGFVAIRLLPLSSNVSITLLIITSSPGGSFSNWWCSLFNAELALSVSLTALSTLLSLVMLPFNLSMYGRSSLDSEIMENLDWIALFTSLGVVVGAVISGLAASALISSHRFNRITNAVGNVAGIALVVVAIKMSFGNSSAQEFQRGWAFYVGVAFPCVAGILVANLVCYALNIKKPECVALSIECCYQNVGLATIVALAMFSGDELKEAVFAPVYYGLVQTVTVCIYCVVMWKSGWTKAPADESLCKVLVTSYEVLEAEHRASLLKNVSPDYKLDEDRPSRSSADGRTYGQRREERLGKLPHWMRRNDPSDNVECA